MIEINLLPGARKKASRRVPGINFSQLGATIASRVKDPYLASAVVSVALAVFLVGAMHVRHVARSGGIAEREQQAVQDSARYAAILKEKRAAEASRDSVARQLEIIRSIDNDRFVWPHLMDEVSRSLPPYTWLTSLQQTSEVVSVAALPAPPAKGTAPTAADSSAAREIVQPPMRFRIVGLTVDIQALTRFMKLLEASEFIQNVHLVRTAPVIADGKDVTEFQLDCEYEQPDPSVIQVVPVSLSVR